MIDDMAVVSVHSPKRSVIHNHVGTGERGNPPSIRMVVILAAALSLEFYVVLLAGVDSIEPIFGECAEFKRGLAIEFAFAKQNRECAQDKLPLLGRC